jgi:hypothetical protein
MKQAGERVSVRQLVNECNTRSFRLKRRRSPVAFAVIIIILIFVLVVL